MRIPKYTVFIGNQGSGKSTAAKLYSSFAWLEKAFVRRTLDPSAFTGENLRTVLSNQNLPGDYLTPDTVIKYRGTAYSIECDSGCVRIEPSGGEDYVLPVGEECDWNTGESSRYKGAAGNGLSTRF